ncbi:transcription-repair coupling factor [Dehalococcoides mccartyi]|uniref:transcription-repair coupling factor n=1 Tax=Dehalococcoides mccartyi TaxID=61435 RepID=UPI0006BDD1AF|nr:transcription-repair coupling factor [Dehalococcoides mccartyi]BAS32150.1 transcription-repair coupling factor [Dehalococcoides mccartyi IBARAKI]
MNLSGLLPLIDQSPSFNSLFESLDRGEADISVLDAGRGFSLAAVYRKLKCPMLVITSQPERARELLEQIAAYSGEEPGFLPDPSLLPYQRAVSDRNSSLEKMRLAGILGGFIRSGDVRIIVTAVPALLQRYIFPKVFEQSFVQVWTGLETEPQNLICHFQKLGYRQESIVEMPGTYSHRGGILDIFPHTEDNPVRLEFFGNTLESLRNFDPQSQRSGKQVNELTISPASEIFHLGQLPRQELKNKLDALLTDNLNPEFSRTLSADINHLQEGLKPEYPEFFAPLFNTSSILDYLPADALVVLDEPASIEQAAFHLDKEAEELRSDRLSQGELPSVYPRPYFSWAEISEMLKTKKRLIMASFGRESESLKLDFASPDNYVGRLTSLYEKLPELKGHAGRVVIVSHQAARLTELLAEEGISTNVQTDILKTPPSASLSLVQGILGAGWSLSGSLHVFTDAELFGFVKQRRLPSKRPVARKGVVLDIKPGEFVVHIDHGVALFSGVSHMNRDGMDKEYLILQYAGGDKLYVPADQMDRVNRFIGSGDEPPSLHRLGTQEWQRAKEKASESAEETARELLEIYAKRELASGYAFSADTVWQQEMEASFSYVETPDQLKRLYDVKEDMEKTPLWTGLYWGDVGYGKTEVAIRAFKAVMDGKQVAVLVPTTVLAQQHYTTFRERLATFPVKVEVLSRFRSQSEQKEVVENLEKGEVDICIGTHRLLQADIKFKDLGLVVIDEEQRFGVAHKEFFKKLRAQVDVLTLSATPIPRTLHMSMVGVRDMSIIETPPGERLPIKTVVAAFDERLIREAILREMERNGQVFFVNNRVMGINLLAERIQQLVPEARIGIGHGQMAEEKLAAVMADFVRHELDVLVCTTIIESGVDVPNANTLIINRADRFGLTQLYQLRGRVGRSSQLAYAYFLYEKEKRLSGDAEKRLKTIYEAAELGAGYGIAMKDLEIRGAGTLLGVKQSGYINSVGFNLYTQMLSEAVAGLKATGSGLSKEEIRLKNMPAPKLDLPLDAFIPEYYIQDLDLRLSIYQQLSALTSLAGVQEKEKELADRFGAMPPELENLLYSIRLRLLAKKAHVDTIVTEGSQIVVRMLGGLIINKSLLEPLRAGVIAGRNQVAIEFQKIGDKWKEVLEEVIWRLG